MYLGFDPLYFLILAPAMILAAWAQWKVKSNIAKAQEYPSAGRITGAQAAQRILRSHGLDAVGIERAQGFLGDHYDPRAKVLRLSPDVYSGTDLAAVGIAAHEVGHAIQDQYSYAPLKLRNAIVPMASFGSGASMIIFIIGMFTARRGVIDQFGNAVWGMGQYLMLAAIALFSVVVIFQLINLPVEFDASRRARQTLVSEGIIAPVEEPIVGNVLNAAAWTYVAATLSAMLTLLYLIMRSGLLGDRRR
jgi:Zn-dependent membrane protease YugP